MKPILYLVLSLAALAAPVRAGCPPYRAPYHAPYYPPHVKYVVLFQVGVETRVEAIAQEAADKADAKATARERARYEKKEADLLSSFRAKGTFEFSGSASAETEASTGDPTPVKTTGTPAAYASCLECHDADADYDTLGGGFKLPEFLRLTANQKAKINKRLIVPDPTRNMAVRAKLEPEEHDELVRAVK